MGCVCGSLSDQKSFYSVSGKRVKSCNPLYSRALISNNSSNFQIFKVNNSSLYTALIKEIHHRLSDTQINDRQDCTEFIDLRSKSQFMLQHLMLFMCFDPTTTKEILQTQSQLKTFFDFKEIFILTEKNTYNTLLELEPPVKALLRSFKDNNVKIKQVNILASDYQRIVKEFPCLIQSNDLKEQQILVTSQIRLPGQVKDKAEEKIIKSKRFPLLIYDHSEFTNDILDIFYNPNHHLAQSQLEMSKEHFPKKDWMVFLQGIEIAEDNVKNDAKFYEKFNIKFILFLTEKKSVSTLLDLYPNNYSIDINDDKQGLKNRIKAVDQLWNSLSQFQSCLILYKNEKDPKSNQNSGLITAVRCIQVVQSFLYEKLYIYENNIYEYFNLRLSKNVRDHLAQHQMVIEPQQIGDTMSQGNKIEAEPKIISRTDEIMATFKNYYNETGQKIELVDNLAIYMNKFMENIINNENEEKYKQILSSNQKLKSIFQYKSGIEMLDKIGFIQQNKTDVYLNITKVDLLKSIKLDFGLALAHFKQSLISKK